MASRAAVEIAISGGGAKGAARRERKKPARRNREARDVYLHSRTTLAYMPSFPLQMHTYVKCKVQMHNDWRGFFWSFMHFGKCQAQMHNDWRCSKAMRRGWMLCSSEGERELIALKRNLKSRDEGT